MAHRSVTPQFLAKLFLITPVLFLVACGGGGGNDGAPITGAADGSLHISGSVGDGPVVGAVITARDASGTPFRTGTSNSQANYELDIPPGTIYPVTLTVSGGTDVVTNDAPSFEMTSIVFPDSTDSATTNINPFTTLIVSTATAMSGGLGPASVATAKTRVLQALGFGLDTRLIADPFTSIVSGQNVANIVKASEALAETIRRVQTTLQINGTDISGEEVIAALGSDLADGNFDGNGPSADPRVTAAAKVVSAAVLVESINNALTVDGAIATTRLDNAISLTVPDATQTTNDVPITAQLLQQTKDAVAAAQALSTDPVLSSLADAIEDITPDSLPSELAGILPSDASSALNNAAVDVATATDTELAAVNQAQASGGGSAGEIEISNTSPSTYTWDILQVGKLAYIDRSYKFTDVPAAYLGFGYLRTANADKQRSGNSAVSFVTDTDITVYVAHDVRIGAKPAWLGGWANTGAQLETDDALFDIFANDFAPGAVILGGNSGSTAGSMYLVMVGPLQSGGEPPPPPPTLSLGADPGSVDYNASSTLNWSSTNATNCTASGAWSGAKGTTGLEAVGPLSTDSIFTLTCTGAGGQTQKSITVTVAPPPPATPAVSLSASPSAVTYGGSATLTWSSTNTNSCTASGGWSGAKALSGNQSTGTLTNDTTFNLSCSGAGGTISQSFTVSVAAAPLPTVTLSANPSAIAYGDSTTLTWASTNASSCVASGDWSGAKATSGSQSTGTLSGDSTYTLTCSGAGGTTSGSFTVSVSAAPAPTVSLGADPGSVDYNASSTLNWSSTNATNCTASGAWSGVKGTTGIETVGPLSTDSIFTLTCTGAGGQTQKSITVTVAPAPPATPTVSLSASPSAVAYGGSATLTWSSTNTDSCTASGGWSGAKALSGNQSTGTLTNDTTFNLSCTGAGGTVSRSFTVSVAAAPLPTVTLSANPSAIAYGDSTTLTWASTNASSCVASGDWSGAKATSGSQSTGTLSGDSTYTLTCSGAGGTTSRSFTVSVSAAPAPTVSLGASPTTVAQGGSTALTWSSSNADSCTASGSWSGVKSTSGNQTVSGLTIDMSFTLTCTGAGGSVSDTVEVTVQQATGTATLNWTPPTTNADGTTLEDLAGYKVHYGTASGDYSTTIPLDNPGLATYVVENLLPGTYFFAVSAYDTSSNESVLSNEVSKTIH